MERLYILDGHGYIYRAYYGLAGSGPASRGVRLTNADGMPTGALYVYTQMLIRLYTDVRPEHVAVVFDAPGRSFRSELDDAYKATRRETPEDLRPQLPFFAEITQALAWPVLCEPGVEADDVIATLTHRARERGWEVVIFSGDKDLMQLVDERVTVIDSLRNVTYDAAQVESKFGVPPSMLRDYLALVGDTSDNVPGMPGVGAKTAAKLLSTHGSIEGILAHTDTLKGKLKERFCDAENQAQLERSRTLVTLRDDLALEAGLDELVPGAWDGDRLQALFTQLAFDSLLKRLDSPAAAAQNENKNENKNENQNPDKNGNQNAGASADQVAVSRDDGHDDDTAAAPGASSDMGDTASMAPAVVEAELPAPVVALDLDALRPVLQAAREARRLAVQVETDGARPDCARVVGVAVGAPGVAPAYLPLAHRYLSAPSQWPALPGELVALLADPDVAVVGHDVKSACRALAGLGVAVTGVAADTMLSAYLLGIEGELSLARLAADAAGLRVPTREDMAGKGKARVAFEGVPVETAAQGAGRAIQAVLAVEPILRARVDEAELGSLLDTLELPLAVLLAEIEQHGITLDVPYLRALSDKLAAQIADIEQRVHALAGEPFNLGSPKQLGSILFEKLGLRAGKMRKTKSGGYSTGHDVLESLIEDHPIIAPILEHREIVKLKGTYLDALPPLVNPRTGRIHTSFNQAVAATGRLSSQDPNLQNIPIRSEVGREIRRAFIAAEGKTLVSVDYSQIELRIVAHLSADPVLIKAFHDDGDVHTQTAAEVFGIPRDQVGAHERRVAKAVNYGLMYGQSDFGLSQALGIPRADARHYMDRYFERFAKVRQFMDDSVARARESGMTMTLLGRRRPIADLNAKNQMRRKAAERMAQNTPVQGSAADIIKLAMLKVAARMRRERFDATMLLTVHDELVFEVAPAQAEDFAAVVVEEMEGAYRLDVPLKATKGIGKTWADVH